MKHIFAILTLLVVTACGPGYQGSFRGSTTSTQTEGGQTGTETKSGEVAYVFGTTKGIIANLGGGNSISFTVSNGSLTADPGQTWTDTAGGTTTNVNTTSGTGTLNGDQLSVTLQQTYTITSPNSNRTGTLNFQFTGTRI